MPQSIEEKRDRFSRIFPSRVEKLMKALEILENCSNKSNYDWTPDTVQRVWVEIGKQFCQVAGEYELDLQILLDGQDLKNIDTTHPLEESK